jgi:hypothetical protein
LLILNTTLCLPDATLAEMEQRLATMLYQQHPATFT